MRKHAGTVQATVGFVILGGFFCALAALLFARVDPTMKEPLLLLVGSLATMAGAVVNYHYGSSAGSARKDELLATSSPMPTDSVTVQQTTTTASQTNGEVKE